jgi:hypothetical protein
MKRGEYRFMRLQSTAWAALFAVLAGWPALAQEPPPAAADAPAQDAATPAAPEATDAAPDGGSESEPDGAAAPPDMKQMKLSDQQITNFIKAQSDLAAVAPKIQDGGETPDPNVQKELEGIATRHGFKDFAELDNVAANISIVMSGLDAGSGEFVDPVDALKKELDDIKSDNELSEADKKRLTDELTEAIKTTPPLEFKENVELVKARKAELDKALD